MTNEIKHTPGPWKVGMGGSIRCDYTDKDGDDIIIGGIKNRSIQIGSSPFSTPNQKEQSANAHLIAAAPELLEALELCEEALKSAGHEQWVAYRATVAAIAKARGRS